MFICQKCNKVSKPGEPVSLVVVDRRVKTYLNESGKESKGWEIAAEEKRCPRCRDL
jgi:hypothetical protein